MSSEFQPEGPHSETGGPAPISKTSVYVAAGISALMVIMILAIVSPRLFGHEETNWGVTLGLGALTFLLVVAGGFWHRSRNNA